MQPQRRRGADSHRVRSGKVSVALTFPPVPFLSHQGRRRGDERNRGDPAAVNHPSPAARERGWGCGQPSPPPSPPSSPTLWERRGEDDAPHLPPSPLSTPTLRERKGERSGAGAMLRGHLSTMPSPPPRSPLSRSAGEGPGVRATRSAGEGLGVRAARTFPPSPINHD